MGYRAGENGCPSPSEVAAEIEANAIRFAEIVANSRRLQADNDRLRAQVAEMLAARMGK